MESSTEKNKLIVKNTIFLYFRSILLLGIGLYTSRLTLQALGVQDYGVYNLVGGLVAMFSMLSNAMSSSSQRFITFALGEGNTERIKSVFRTSLSLHIILAFILFILIELLGLWLLNNELVIPKERMHAANVVFHFSVITLMIGIICIPFDALIIAHERMKAFAYIGIIEAIVKFFVAFCLLYTSKDRLILYSFFLFCSSLIKATIYVLYVRSNFIESRSIKLEVSRSQFNEMFQFACWSLFGHGTFILRNQGIDVLMNTFFGVVVNAAKGVCNQVQTAVMQFVTNFQTAMFPQMTKSIAEGDFSRTYMLINTGSRFSFYLLMMFSVPLCINIDFILDLWLVEVPEYTSVFIKLTMFYQLMDTLSRCMMHSISSTGRIKKYEICVGIIKLLALPLTYLFLYLGGNPTTGLIVNIALEVFALLIRLYFNNKLLNFPVKQFIVDVVFKCWTLFLLTYIICYLLLSFINQGVWLIIITACVTLFSIFIFGFSRNERNLVLKKIHHSIARS